MIKIATWNVNGIRARYAEVHAWIELERPDVVCLQEIKAAPDDLPRILIELGDYWCCWHGSRGYSGVALHVRKDLAPQAPTFVYPDFDYENRIVSVDVRTDLGDVTIASVYVPNGGRDFRAKMAFLTAMDAYATSFQRSGRTLVLSGDLNVARTNRDVHPKERRPRAIGQLPEERALLEQILSRGLVDVGRAVDPHNDGLFTWWAPWRNMRQRNIGWRLDYVLASESLAGRVSACPVQKEVGTSDHAPVVASFV